MKTRKKIIAVLAAVLVISAFLVASCIDPLEEVAKSKAADDQESSEIDDNYPVPAGKGVIRLKLSDSNIRTILPDNDFTSLTYNIGFASKTSHPGNNQSLTNKTYAALIDSSPFPIVLEADTYTCSVTARNAAGNVASWADEVTITAGQAKTITVTLEAYGVVLGQTGKFTINVTPSGTSGSVTIIDILSGGISGTTIGDTYDEYDGITYEEFPITLAAANNNTITLDTGYYIVKVTATLANYQTYENIQALHIYQNMTSIMAPQVTVPALTKNVFDVSYNMNGETNTNPTYANSSPWTSEAVSYAHYATNKGNPTHGTMTFGGWYTDSSTTVGNEWGFSGGTGTPSNNRVIADLPLFAKWVSGTTANGNFAISFPINDVMSGTVTPPAQIKRTEIYSSNTYSIKLAAPNTGSWTAINWSCSGKDLTGHIDDADGLTGNVLIINNSDTFLDLLGNATLDVYVVATYSGGGDFSLHIEIPIVNGP